MKTESQRAPEGPPEALRTIREQIDDLDSEILELMARRFDFARRTLSVKERHGLGPVDTRREAEVVRRAASRAREHGLEAELVRDIFWRLIELSKTSPTPTDGPVSRGTA